MPATRCLAASKRCWQYGDADSYDSHRLYDLAQFDAITFYVLLNVFGTSETEFHNGWFVESLATQVLVQSVIRTAGKPLRSRPSAPLVATCLAVVAAGMYLPFSPLANLLRFAPLPLGFFAFVAVATAA